MGEALARNYELFFQFIDSQRASGSDRANCRVLDYGCGTGRVVVEGRRRGYDVLGVDNFYGDDDYARRALAATEHIRVLGPDGTIPWPDGFFDVIISNQVLEHVVDLETAAREMRRVLRDTGVMLHVFPTVECIREGHIGVPLVHWFGGYKRLRYWYTLAARLAGIGYHKDARTPSQWTSGSLAYLDAFVCYRSWHKVGEQLTKYFTVESYTRQQLQWHLAAQRRLLASALRLLLHFGATAGLLCWAQWLRAGRSVICRPRRPPANGAIPGRQCDSRQPTSAAASA